jgi:hypothetical protein
LGSGAAEAGPKAAPRQLPQASNSIKRRII